MSGRSSVISQIVTIPTQLGDKWTFVALDADSKLVPCYRVGQRTLPEAKAFLKDLESRLTNRVQLSSDALSAYVEASEAAFGANVDYGDCKVLRSGSNRAW